MHTKGNYAAAAAAKSLQSCPILCDPIDGSPPGFPIPGILQARTLGMGCHFLLQGNLLDPGIKPTSLASPALEGMDSLSPVPPGKPMRMGEIFANEATKD